MVAGCKRRRDENVLDEMVEGDSRVHVSGGAAARFVLFLVVVSVLAAFLIFGALVIAKVMLKVTDKLDPDGAVSSGYIGRS